MSRGQCNQPFRMFLQPCKSDVGLLLHRTVEMGGGDELAEVGIALLVLGKQRQPVDCRLAANFCWARDGEHRADDRLDSLRKAGLAERHDAIEAVAVRQRDCRKTELRRAFRDRLGLHRPFEHGEGRKYAKRDERLSHALIYGMRPEIRKGAASTYPPISAVAASGLP